MVAVQKEHEDRLYNKMIESLSTALKPMEDKMERMEKAFEAVIISVLNNTLDDVGDNMKEYLSIAKQDTHTEEDKHRLATLAKETVSIIHTQSDYISKELLLEASLSYQNTFKNENKAILETLNKIAEDVLDNQTLIVEYDKANSSLANDRAKTANMRAELNIKDHELLRRKIDQLSMSVKQIVMQTKGANGANAKMERTLMSMDKHPYKEGEFSYSRCAFFPIVLLISCLFPLNKVCLSVFIHSILITFAFIINYNYYVC